MELSQSEIQFFQENLLAWAAHTHRPLPWKGSQNPYHIWLSEILLQQTRTEQGLPYYEKFVAQFPTITDLADASEDEVFKLWQGLGYYARARNLHATAKFIAYQLDGKFPDAYADIRALKGVGDYTAAAIASFAYNLPHAVVDGNVYRVLSRFFGIDTPIDSTEGKKQFADLAQQLLDTEQPARYNQAIMDFGAIHCKPQQPICSTCLHQAKCVAFQQKKTAILPVKSNKLVKKDRFFYYFIYNFDQHIQLHKRTSKDIWQGLYDFPLLELDKNYTPTQLQMLPEWRDWQPPQSQVRSVSQPFRQELSHQKIIGIFVEMELENGFFLNDENYISIPRSHFERYAVPKLLTSYWEGYNKTPTLF